jgi:hypothetical protein
VRHPAIPLDLRICPGCLATFLPARLYAALRREVYPATRKKWRAILAERGGVFDERARLAGPAKICCLDHGESLAEGEMPQYGHKCLVPACCDLQHIPPALMVKVLDFGLEMAEAPQARPTGKRGVWAWTNGISRLFLKWFDKQPDEENALEMLQYTFKFQDILEAPQDLTQKLTQEQT